MLISKLSAAAYPTLNPYGRLTGSDYKEIDPVFAERLSACCIMDLTEGKRTHETQREYRAEADAYKRTGKLGPHGIKTAAKEGESFHEFGLAIDTSTSPIRQMTNAQLAKYGLFKPIAKEPWHIQPIETKGVGNNASVPKAKALYPVEQEEPEVVKEINVIINGVQKTVSAINVNGSNFVQLRDLSDALDVGYDSIKKMPVISKKGA